MPGISHSSFPPKAAYFLEGQVSWLTLIVLLTLPVYHALDSGMPANSRLQWRDRSGLPPDSLFSPGTSGHHFH